MDPNQNKPWYPNGAPIPGQEQGPQAPPFPPAPTAQHGLPPQQPYQTPTPQQIETPAQTDSYPSQPAAAPPQPVVPQYSIDYLNQIAPEAKKPGLDNRMFLFIIGGGLVLAAIVGMLTLFSGGNGPTEKMQTLAARMATLQTVTEKSQKNIKSNALRSTNSSLNIFLTDANHDIAEPLMNNGVDVKKIDKKIETAEKGEELTKKLEDARLNAVFDRVYAREMSYQLSTVESLMNSIYRQTKSKSLKAFLKETDGNIAPIIKQLDGFNATTTSG